MSKHDFSFVLNTILMVPSVTGFFNSSQLKLSYTMTESILTLNCGQVLTKVDFFIQNFKKNCFRIKY